MDETDDLRARLAEAEETLRAIRHGEVDALLILDGAGERVYTLRGADAPYRALVEQMQEGAAALSATGDIIYCNKRFAELVNAPLQQVIGAPIEQFIDASDRAPLGQLLADGAGKLRTRLRQTGMPAIDAHISVSNVTLDEVEHRTLIVTDVSTLTKVQRESRSKDEFLAMLAHELRNPLGAIAGAVQVLRLGTLRDPRAVRARDVIERQVLHMARLVDDLLDVGRVVTGKIVLDRRPIDLAESVRACVAALRSSLPVDRPIEVDARSVWIQADPVRLEQIVGNLVSNALKFTPVERRVRVEVDAEDADAVLRVSDEGSGIDPELLPFIFDLFVQADVTIDRSKGGLGIGLTLVRRLVELHDGTISVRSAGVGEGATFTVRLPAAVNAVAEAAGLPPRPPRASRRILLVDDHNDARDMSRVLLQAGGHEVHEADNGATALSLFHRLRPDVAIIDIGLPGIDGYELAKLIRASPGGGRVTLMAVTGYGFPEDRERSRLAGFDRHLVKPASVDDILRELDDLAPVRGAGRE
jgi:signal transduction histidine kinase